MSQIITNQNDSRIINPVDQIKAGIERETYGFVSTREMLDVFESKGWTVASTSVVKPRKAEKIGFQRHLICLENTAFPAIPGLSTDNASRPQICVLNSHDGTTAVRMFLGLLRIACLNGIIAGLSLKDFKAVHSKNVATRIGDGIEYLSDNIGTLFEQVQQLQGMQLNDAALNEYVKTVVDARLKNVRNIQTVDYSSALRVRRDADKAQDAFTVLNRVQESIVRGGIEYSYLRNIRDDKEQIVEQCLTHTRTRALKSVPSQVNLNRLIYDKALELAS